MPERGIISSLRIRLTQMMTGSGVPLPGLEADRIVCGALGVSRASLHAHPERELRGWELERALEFGIRRASGEPLAYILNDAIFRGRSFYVDKRVLIPRPETEMLTRLADACLKRFGRGVFADWCTGSGCIAITLLEDNPGFKAYAADSSPDALDVAKYNALSHGVGDRVKFIECEDPAEALVIAPASLDMIILNPPYIREAAIETLETQVKDYEPRAALDGGPDGLSVIMPLLSRLPFFMKRGAHLFLETGGDDQTDEIMTHGRNIAADMTLSEISEDHRGIARFMVWRKLS
ncbi:MAG: peptide chain release factor N(5)-glutamine methyltransferase [Synergistaceae bacterium]|jgi:release factor glutamine methyltransferase|nr:peptide chain release factor N(5)-glutamine methyltransferase [Synergistaceae bacterium]